MMPEFTKFILDILKLLVWPVTFLIIAVMIKDGIKREMRKNRDKL